MTTPMKDVKTILMVSAAMAVWMFSFIPYGIAQQMPGTFAQQIQGSWTLVSCVNEQDGKKFDVFGSNPKGSFILTPDGHFSLILMRSDLPKFAANSRLKGTDKENEAVVHGSHAFFGTYTITSEKDHAVDLMVEGSSFPNQNGGIQKRIITIAGDELRVVNPTPAIGSGTNYLILKRSK
ncbi:MAG: lipocalin-like domain-containing protein [Nitrospirota bacterium]